MLEGKACTLDIESNFMLLPEIWIVHILIIQWWSAVDILLSHCARTHTHCPDMVYIESFFILKFVLWQLLSTWLWPELTEHLQPPAHRPHAHTYRHETCPSAEVTDWQVDPDPDHYGKDRKKYSHCFFSLFRLAITQNMPHKKPHLALDELQRSIWQKSLVIMAFLRLPNDRDKSRMCQLGLFLHILRLGTIII